MPVRADVERVQWDDFLDRRFRWQQGEHTTLVGPTGGGKTTLMLRILDRRQYVVLLASKPKDSTLAGLVRRGKAGRASDAWCRIGEWPPPALRHRVLLWPPFTRIEHAHRQQQAFEKCLREVFEEGGWTVAADDLNYLCRIGLGPLFEFIWLQGRSNRVTLVSSVQRPAHVPLLAYSQATHLFFWRSNDERDLKRIGGLNGVNDRMVRDTVANLALHDVLYVNTRTGELMITRVER